MLKVLLIDIGIDEVEDFRFGLFGLADEFGGFGNEAFRSSAVFESGGIDADVHVCSTDGSAGCESTYAGIAGAGGVTFLGHGTDDGHGAHGGLHGAQGHLGSIERSGLHGFGAGGFLLVGAFRHGEYIHDLVE